MKRRLLIATLVATVASALAVAGCGSGGESSGGSGSGQIASDLTIARSADAVTLDPRQATENQSIWTSQLLYSTLFTSSKDGKKVLPALAESYETSKNGLEWTFQLRKGVVFSDGTPLTAKDVVFSLELARKPSAPWAFILEAVKSISAAGKEKVVIDLKHPYAPLLADLALFANSVVPDNFGGKSEKAFYENPVGTGPYVLDHWEHGTSIVLKANPHWWGGPLKVKTLTLDNVSNDNSRVLQLQGGQVNVIESPPLSQLAQISGRPGTEVTEFPSTYSRFLTMNQRTAPLNDIHVRRAIWYALNRNAIVKAVLFGKGEVANSFFSNSLPYYDPSTPSLPYDMAKAKEEMAKSSAPEGFSTSITVGAGDSTENALGQAIQAALAPLGIKVSLRPVDVTTEFTNYLEKGDFELALNYYTSDIPDPDEIVSFMVAVEFLVGYKNPKVSALASEAAEELDSTKRAQMYAEMQKIVAEDAVWVPLYYAPYVYANDEEGQGFGVTALGSYVLPGMEPGK